MLSIIPKTSVPDHQISHRRRRRLSKRDRIGLIVALAIIAAVIPANFLWSTSLFPAPVVAVILIVGAIVKLPHVAFGSVAAVIFATGCCVKWPPSFARLSATRRGLALLFMAIVLNCVWFRFSWIPFEPMCSGGFDPFYGGETLLEGPLDPRAASMFVEVLQRQYGEDAAQLSGPDTVLVHPAVVVFRSSGNWNYSRSVAEALGGDGAIDDCTAMEAALMANGHATSKPVGFGSWPWNTLAEDGDIVRWLQPHVW